MSESESDTADTTPQRRRGLPRRLFESLWYGEPLRPKVAARGRFLFEDRSALIADLLALRRQGDLTVETWSAQVVARLLQEPPFAPLAKTLQGQLRTAKARAGKNVEEKGEDLKPIHAGDPVRVTEVIDAAISLAQRHPVAAFGRDVQALIAEEVERAIQSSSPVRAARWLAPLVIAGLLGGTIYGGVQVEGTLAKIRDQQVKVDNSERAFEQKSAQALVAFEQSLQKQVAPQVDGIVKAATATYTTQMNGEITGLPSYFAAEKAKFLAEENATGQRALSDGLREIERSLGEKKTTLGNDLDKTRSTIEAGVAAKQVAIDSALGAIGDSLVVRKNIIEDLLDKKQTTAETALAAKQTAIETSLDGLNAAVSAKTVELAKTVASFQKAIGDDLAAAPTQIGRISDRIEQVSDRMASLQRAVTELQETAGDIKWLRDQLVVQSSGHVPVADYLRLVGWQGYVSAAAGMVSIVALIVLAVGRRSSMR